MATKTLRLDKGQIEVVDDRVAAILKAKTGPERLKMVWDAWSFFGEMITAHLRSQHPDWSAEQVRKELVRRVAHGTK